MEFNYEISKGGKQDMAYGILMLNLGVCFLLTVGILDPIVGVIYTAISAVVSILLSDTCIGRWVLVLFIKNKGALSDNVGTSERKILVSVGCVGFAIKAAVVYGVIFLAGVVVVMFIVLILAFGLLFERKAGDLSKAFYLAKIIAKVAVFLNSWTDPILNFIIKKEFEWLGVETI